MLERLACGAALVLSATALPAYADWQYTRWGMSPEQVIAAAPDRVKRLDKPEPSYDGRFQQLLSAPYRVESFDLEAQMFFDLENRLVSVSLEAKDPRDCSALTGMMTNRYGVASNVVKNDSVEINVWRDETAGNSVSMANFAYGTGCSVGYRKIEAASSPGGL